MLSSQDEAGKLEFSSEKFFYHSVYSNSFFSNSFIQGRAGNVSLLGRLHTTLHKKVFFPGGKNFGYVKVACNFCNFVHIS